VDFLKSSQLRYRRQIHTFNLQTKIISNETSFTFVIPIGFSIVLDATTALIRELGPGSASNKIQNGRDFLGQKFIVKKYRTICNERKGRGPGSEPW
ncbi:MAG: hypothetical protein AAF765_10545, partial [Bacteroidota bacterium]